MSFLQSVKNKIPTKLRQRLNKALTVFLWCYFVAFGIAVLHYARRAFVAERFSIPTLSMSPTLVPGDKIWVNKLLFGARIYKSFDFVDHAPLECFRMPGLRRIRPNDVIVFNYPFGYDDWSRIEFKINYVYCKRVAGTPGDTISICDGITHNSNYDGVIGLYEKQLQLQSIPDSVFWSYNSMTAIPLSLPQNTIKNLAPMLVPAKGQTIELTEFNRHLYGLIIQYETGCFPSDSATSYTFTHDYYFVLGDNSPDSRDSRYIGFIPDDFIIGIVGGRKVRNGLSAE
ncbi:MAG: signal peptidase I [Salinivirgaceae bacterium]|nr:signal peptidase I [Salinivirgaceae bacterium]